MRKLLLAAVAVGGIFAVVTVAVASHSWSGYHWARTSNPFTLKLGDNLSADWDGVLVDVSNDWSASTVLDTTTVAGGTTGAACAPTLGRVEVCNADYGNNGWLGLASVWIYLGSKHIAQGTAKVNDFYFNQANYNNPNARRHVMCQEVGHTLGLGHNENGKKGGSPDDTCMNDRAGLFDPAFVDPNQHDYDQLIKIYSHLDSSTSVAAKAQGSAAGRALDALPAGAGPEDGNVFARDLGDGRLLITFVTWADR